MYIKILPKIKIFRTSNAKKIKPYPVIGIDKSNVRYGHSNVNDKSCKLKYLII